jgi:DNA-binding NarL/FixJ family response regulator
MQRKLSVAFVDDQPLFRQGIVQTLLDHHDIDIVGQGSSASEATAIAAATMPDVIVLGTDMAGGCMDIVGTLAANYPATSILVLAGSEHQQDLRTAFTRGAKGFVSKEASGYELVQAIRTLAGGGFFVSPRMSASLFAFQEQPRSERRAPPEQMTFREEQILSLLGEGLTNKEIARRIDLHEKTVKGHLTKIMEKLRVSNRVQAALVARKRVPAGRESNGLLQTTG